MHIFLHSLGLVTCAGKYGYLRRTHKLDRGRRGGRHGGEGRRGAGEGGAHERLEVGPPPHSELLLHHPLGLVRLRLRLSRWRQLARELAACALQLALARPQPTARQAEDGVLALALLQQQHVRMLLVVEKQHALHCSPHALFLVLFRHAAHALHERVLLWLRLLGTEGVIVYLMQ